ncbi:hypothetical protein TNIN_99581 [Trichonephila inaurata madagascariensis]|uniref:Uncharacterized protein n=1 Tax=Trichonephila inaurata madagascariensis TaxID=2747483 RepID=A0A8X6X9E9_9ARAC|nr:hypothetical protein TNIN_99581 [Trichonephila inaurata madagascariensis]
MVTNGGIYHMTIIGEKGSPSLFSPLADDRCGSTPAHGDVQTVHLRSLARIKGNEKRNIKMGVLVTCDLKIFGPE